MADVHKRDPLTVPRNHSNAPWCCRTALDGHSNVLHNMLQACPQPLQCTCETAADIERVEEYRRNSIADGYCLELAARLLNETITLESSEERALNREDAADLALLVVEVLRKRGALRGC